MPKRTWNSFVSDHPKATTTAFGVAVTGFPKGAIFDKDRKKLPTPYALAQNWLGRTLAGDWTTMKDGDAFVILVSDPGDAALVLKKFPAVGAPAKSKIADKSYPVGYRAATFATLVKEAGFVVTLPNQRPSASLS